MPIESLWNPAIILIMTASLWAENRTNTVSKKEIFVKFGHKDM